MHAEPARDWTEEALAQAVHVSRSVLAERFTAVVGLPPIRYLKRWRLAIAARMLCSQGANLIRLAGAHARIQERLLAWHRAAGAIARQGRSTVRPGSCACLRVCT